MEQLEKAQFRATTGASEGFGTTPQEALSALTQHLPADDASAILILPYNRGDAFFTDAQHARQKDLKSRRATLTEAERTEWEGLIEAEVNATVARIQALFRAHGAEGAASSAPTLSGGQ